MNGLLQNIRLLILLGVREQYAKTINNRYWHKLKNALIQGLSKYESLIRFFPCEIHTKEVN